MPMLSEKEVRQLLEDTKFQLNEERGPSARAQYISGMMYAYRKVLKE